MDSLNGSNKTVILESLNKQADASRPVYNPFVEDCDRRPPQEAFNPNFLPRDDEFNEYNCEICKFKSSSKLSYDKHISSDLHKKNLDSYLQNKFQVSFDSLMGMSNSNNPEIRSSDYKLRCDICNIDLSSKIVHDQHMSGKNHQKKLKLLKGSSAVKELLENKIKSSENANEFFCEICKIGMKTKEQYDAHVSGKKHKSQETKHKFNENFASKLNNTEEFLTPANLKVGNRSKFDYFCKRCQKFMEDKMQLWMHINSKQHQNKVTGRAVPWSKEQVAEHRARKALSKPKNYPKPAPVFTNFVKGDTLYQPLQAAPQTDTNSQYSGTEFLRASSSNELSNQKRKYDEDDSLQSKRIQYKMPEFYKNQLQTQQANFESNKWNPY